jgi:hypothetical protein
MRGVGGENQKACRANKAHLLLLREDGREIGWMKGVWKRRETIEGWGIKKNVILICFGIVSFFLDKIVYRNPLKPVGQNKVYTYIQSYIHTDLIVIF